MASSRIRRLIVIITLIVGTLFIFWLVPAFAAEQVLAIRSAVGNHYETPLVLDLTAGQVINIDAYCTDASGTGITYVHYVEVGAVPTAEHPEYNDSIYYRRWDCLGGINEPFTAPVSTQYRFIFHVHTNEYGCGDAESCPTLTGISHFNYYLKVTTNTGDGIPPEPTVEVTPDPIITAEPTPEATTDPSVPLEPTPEATSDPSVTLEPTAEVTDDPSATPSPTEKPPKAVSPLPVVTLPEMARDARLNFKTGDLTAVIYRNRDDKGAPALVIYGVNASSRGYLLCTITIDDLGSWAQKTPDQNELVKTCSENVFVYVLSSGEIQINIIEDNKIFSTVLDSLAAKVIQHILQEA